MRFYQKNAFFYTVISLVVLITSVLVWSGDTKAASAQNTACIGSTEFIANHQLAEQAISAQVQQHADIYNKDSSELTPDDVQIIADDVAFYASKLAEIDAPVAVRATLMTEIAMYYTLSAMLYTATTAINVDLTSLYDQAGSSLGGALQYHADNLIATCSAYEAVYGDYASADGTA